MSTDYEFKPFDFDELVELLQRNENNVSDKVSYHEILKNNLNRMFFDVDFNHPPEAFDYKLIKEAIVQVVKHAIKAHYTIYIAKAMRLVKVANGV